MTYKIGDRVEHNNATVSVHQLAQFNREFPGGRRGVVVAIDETFVSQPYSVRWDDGARAYYADRELLPVAVPSAQAGLFEGVNL